MDLGDERRHSGRQMILSPPPVTTDVPLFVPGLTSVSAVQRPAVPASAELPTRADYLETWVARDPENHSVVVAKIGSLESTIDGAETLVYGLDVNTIAHAKIVERLCPADGPVTDISFVYPGGVAAGKPHWTEAMPNALTAGATYVLFLESKSGTLALESDMHLVATLTPERETLSLPDDSILELPALRAGCGGSP